MARGNTTGRVLVKGSLATYDKLPKSVRQKLANANHDWSPEECEEMLWLDSPAYVIDFLTRADQAMTNRHYAILASGQPYPKETKK